MKNNAQVKPARVICRRVTLDASEVSTAAFWVSPEGTDIWLTAETALPRSLGGECQRFLEQLEDWFLRASGVFQPGGKVAEPETVQLFDKPSVLIPDIEQDE